MATFEFQNANGEIFEIEAPDQAAAVRAFQSASPAQFGQLSAPAAQPPASTVASRSARGLGLGVRNLAQGAVTGVLGLPAIGLDALNGVRAAGRMAGAAAGIGEYNERDYFPDAVPDASLPQRIANSLPFVGSAARIARAAPDAIGLPEPETRGERIASAVAEGGTSAFTGAGMASLLARGPGLVGSAARTVADAPGLQTAAGAASGAAAQSTSEAGGNDGAAMAAGVLAGLPFGMRLGTGRVTSSMPEGQDAIAGATLRRAAGAGEVPTTMDRLTRAAAGDTNLPGFRLTGSAASRNYGLAALGPKFRSWANLYDEGATARMERDNASILSRELDLHGGERGAAADTRRVATDFARDKIADFNLSSLPSQDIDDLLTDLNSTIRNRAVPGATQDLARDIRTELLARAKPVVRKNAQGENVVVGHRINPDAIHALRKDLSEARYVSSQSGAGRLASANQALHETQEYMNQLDDMLDDATGGRWRKEYLEPFANARNEADQQGFMETFGERVSAPSGAYDNGARQIVPGQVLRQSAALREDMPVGHEGRNMSLSNMRERGGPQGRRRADFIAGVREDYRRANFGNERGIRPEGSPTAQNQEITDWIKDDVVRMRSPMQKAAGAILGLGEITGAAATRLGSIGGLGALGNAVGGTANRGIVRSLRDRITGNTDAAFEGVAARLGRAEMDPAEMARLMRTEMPQAPSLTAMGRRAVVRGGILGAEGILAGERTKRYR